MLKLSDGLEDCLTEPGMVSVPDGPPHSAAEEASRVPGEQFVWPCCLLSSDSRQNSLLGAPPSFHHQPQFSRWVVSAVPLASASLLMVNTSKGHVGPDAALLLTQPSTPPLQQRSLEQFVQLNEASLMQLEAALPCTAAIDGGSTASPPA